jgi:hypothetical protein
MSAETIEEMAHNFLFHSRKFDNRHDWKEVDAAPVESWIERETTVLLGERIKAKSWVLGLKVFAEFWLLISFFNTGRAISFMVVI